MSPLQVAVLLYTLGTAAAAVYVARQIRDIEEADPLDLCDDCRDDRREWMTVASVTRAAGPWFVPLVALIAAAMWPVTAPLMGWSKLRYGKHVCADNRRAAREEADD